MRFVTLALISVASVVAAPCFSEPYLEGIKPAEARHVVGVVTSAQADLASGKKQSFELSFGARAADAAVEMSPKSAFLSLDLRHPSSVKRAKDSATSNYVIHYLPNGAGPAALVWEVRISLGPGDHVDSIAMTKTIAAP